MVTHGKLWWIINKLNGVNPGRVGLVGDWVETHLTLPNTPT
jgi:hypothetical protein